MAFHAPQEKKQLSYERDRRNCHGEHSKGSRKLIPLRKTKARKAQRRATTATLSAVPRSTDLLEDDSPENRIRGFHHKRWRKVPDVPLGVAVAAKKKARSQRVGSKKRRRGARASRA